jgi:hypothetical protein
MDIWGIGLASDVCLLQNLLPDPAAQLVAGTYHVDKEAGA